QAQTFTRRRRQAVDAVQERSERLPRPRRCLDEDVTALRDRRPAENLGRRRLGKCPLEPRARLRREDRERVHGAQTTGLRSVEQVFAQTSSARKASTSARKV